MPRQSRPSNRLTNADLVLGTVGGFFLGLLLMAVVLVPLSLLLSNSVRLPDWVPSTLSTTCIVAGLVAGEAFLAARVAERRRRYDEHRTGALRQRRCPVCKYDLRGTVEPRCPECGEAFTAQEWKHAKHDTNNPG